MNGHLPRGDDLFLDHVGYFTADLEAAAPRLGRLGFTVSPINLHYNSGPDGALEPSGTANRLVTFRAGYIEVLAKAADTPLAAQLDAALARYEGMHLLAVAHRDVESHDVGGVPMQPTVHLRRPLGDGRTVRATVRRAVPGAMPEGRVQLLTHGTPDLIWQPGMQDHANAAEALTGWLVVVADPQEAARRFASLLGVAPVESGPVLEIRLARGRIAVLGPEAAHLLPDVRIRSLPFQAMLSIETGDLDRTRQVLGRGGVRVADRDDRVMVAPEDGLGAVIDFHGPGAPMLWEGGWGLI